MVNHHPEHSLDDRAPKTMVVSNYGILEEQENGIPSLYEKDSPSRAPDQEAVATSLGFRR